METNIGLTQHIKTMKVEIKITERHLTNSEDLKVFVKIPDNNDELLDGEEDLDCELSIGTVVDATIRKSITIDSQEYKVKLRITSINIMFYETDKYNGFMLKGRVLENYTEKNRLIGMEVPFLFDDIFTIY